MWYSRRNNLSRTKAWPIGKKRKSFNIRLKKPRDIHQKESPEASIQTLIKANFTKFFCLDTKNQSTKPISFIGPIGSIGATGSTSSTGNIDTIGFIGNIKPPNLFWFWKISPNNY
jgi:hypothetical protein